MQNKAMQRKLKESDCISVEKIGKEIRPGLWELSSFEDDVDYCVVSTEEWIWSIGKRISDGKIFASIYTEFYQNPDYECLWLR